MAKSKLILLLETFSEEELKRFEDFLDSGYLNNSPTILQFFHSLKPFLRDEFPGKDVWKSIQESENWDDGYLRKLRSTLLGLAKKFLFIEDLEETDFEVEMGYLNHLVDRGLFDLHDKEVNVLRKRREKNLETSSVQTFLDESILEESLYYAGVVRAQRSRDNNFEEIESNLDKYYLIKKIKFWTEKVFFRRIFNTVFEEEPAEWLKQAWAAEEFASLPIARLYQSLLELVRYEGSEGKDRFGKWRDLTKEHLKSISLREQEEVLNIGTNFCISNINRAIEAPFYLKEMLDIFSSRIESGSLLRDGRIYQWDFHNIISAALMLDDFDLAWKWIHELKGYLLEVDYENALNFNLGIFYFQKGEYSKCLKHLNEVDHSDEFYAIGVRSLQIKAYWEMKDFEPLDHKIQSSIKFIRPHKVFSEDKKKRYVERFKLMAKFIREDAKAQIPASKLAELEKELDALTGNPDKTYLRAKLEAMKARNKT